MAVLVDNQNNKNIHLHACHSFGRLIYSVDTLISLPEMSKIHAIIEWESNAWIIRDISKNGTWCNGQKLLANIKHPLNIGDTLCFGKKLAQCFTVSDLAPPCDLLIPVNHIDVLQPIKLNNYHFLPSDDEPQVALFFNKTHGTWCLENLQLPNASPSLLTSDESIYVEDQEWRLHLARIESGTVELTDDEEPQAIVKFIFNMSQNEESTHLTVSTPSQSLDLNYRAHHYLILCLARKRATDMSKKVEHSQQGWVYAEDLAKELGINVEHLNIQVHRARKQIADRIDLPNAAEYLIERRPGEIRFGSPDFEIYKGDVLECKLSNNDERMHHFANT